jgi:catechol 2,3-dioxygenase-like lactoylglutathione lyase family enzyme
MQTPVRFRGDTMIDHVVLGVHHLDESRYFYEHALAPLGIKIVLDRHDYLGLGDEATGRPFFFLSVRETSRRVHVARVYIRPRHGRYRFSETRQRIPSTWKGSSASSTMSA